MQFMMHPLTPAERLREGRSRRSATSSEYLLSLEPPKYPFADRPDEGREGRGGVQATTARSATAPTARSGRTRTRWSRWTRSAPTRSGYEGVEAGVRRRRTRSRGSAKEQPRRLADGSDRDQGLPGPAARRHLGDRPVLPQRQRADAVPRAELEGPAEALHAQLPDRRGATTTRRRSAGRSRSCSAPPDAKLPRDRAAEGLRHVEARPRQRRPHLRRRR